MFVLAMVAMLVLGSVSPALADPGSQTWWLKVDDYTGQKEAGHTHDKQMSKEPNSETFGTGLAGAGEYWFYAGNAASCDVSFGDGTWTIGLDVTGRASGATIYCRVYSVAANGAPTALSAESDPLVLGVWEDYHDNVICTGTGQTIPMGSRLALQIRFDSGEGTVYVNGTDTNWDSKLTSPSSDPGYPVPELPTIVLLSIGIFGLGGYLWLKRRRG